MRIIGDGMGILIVTGDGASVVRIDWGIVGGGGIDIRCIDVGEAIAIIARGWRVACGRGESGENSG